MFCGLLTTFLVPETKRKSLEELAGEGEGDGVYELQFREGFFRVMGRKGKDGAAAGAEGDGEGEGKWRFWRMGSRSTKGGSRESREDAERNVGGAGERAQMSEVEMRGAREGFYMQR